MELCAKMAKSITVHCVCVRVYLQGMCNTATGEGAVTHSVESVSGKRGCTFHQRINLDVMRHISGHDEWSQTLTGKKKTVGRINILGLENLME